MQAPPSELQQTEATNAPLFPRQYMRPFLLVTVLFFLWGMSNNLTDILVQQFRKSFELTWFKAQLVQTANFMGYFAMAIPSAILLRRFGYKRGILTGLVLFGTGMILFWPAAVMAQYGWFLAALFIVGCGASMLETAANPFISQLGAQGSSERRLNFTQSFNPPGTITGVLIGTFFIFSGVELTAGQTAAMKQAGTYTGYLHQELMRVVPTYVGLGLLVMLWALFIARTSFPALQGEEDKEQGTFRDLLRFPQLWAAIAAQFFYEGAQVTIWSNVIPYLKQYTVVTERHAAWFLTGNLVAMAIGRFGSTALMRWMPARTMMGIYALINIALLGFSIASPGWAGAVAILTTSLFMSIMFPTIFALGIKGLGHHTKLGGSLIVMAVVGAALFPPLSAEVARLSGRFSFAYLPPLISFIWISIYSLRGGRAKQVTA